MDNRLAFVHIRLEYPDGTEVIMTKQEFMEVWYNSLKFEKKDLSPNNQ